MLYMAAGVVSDTAPGAAAAEEKATVLKTEGLAYSDGETVVAADAG